MAGCLRPKPISIERAPPTAWNFFNLRRLIRRFGKGIPARIPKMKVCPHRDRSHVRRPNCLPDLRTLCESVQTAQMNAARALRDLASSVASANGILQGLPDAARRPCRILHAAHRLRGSARRLHHRLPGLAPGAVQSRAWPQDLVHLPGFAGRAVRNPLPLGRGGIRRHCLRRSHARPGDIVTATQGLHQIHRLGNASPDVAISLHIYGVDQADICSGVNHLIDKVLDASPRR